LKLKALDLPQRLSSGEKVNNNGDFDTFRNKSGQGAAIGGSAFKNNQIIEESPKNREEDVFSSPLFVRNNGNGLIASIRSSLRGLNNLLHQRGSNNQELDKESNKSSPTKLSPSKFSGNLLP
jgi:hypothetical protein